MILCEGFSWACQLYANMRLPHISLIVAFFAYFSKSAHIAYFSA